MKTAELVRKCRQGDAKAWQSLVRQLTPLAYRLCLRMLRNPAEAEDASQETFMRVYKYFDRYDPTRPIEPWLSSVAYNVCLQRLAKTKKVPEGADGSWDLPDSSEGGTGTEARVARREAAGLLEGALGSLAAQDRAILHMHYWQGFSTSEVSRATDMPVNTIKTRLFRARNRLREFLTPVVGGA